MKNIKKLIAVSVSLIMIALIFCSCASDSKYNSAEAVESAEVDTAMDVGDWGWDSGVNIESSDNMVEAPAAGSQTGNNELDDNATSDDKIIKNGNLSIETLEFDKFISELDAAVSEFGGYIEESSTYGARDYRSADYTIRIPYKKYDSFISVIGNLATVTSSSESIENVTLQYIDIEARLDALKAERDSFMELMDRAETIDDILQIQSHLTDVNYQIESYTSQLKALENKVSYSTIRLDVAEVARITPEQPKTVWERISTGFSESIYSVKEGFKNLFVGFVVATPYLAVYAVVIIIIVVVIVIIVKQSKKKQQKRIEEFRAKQQQQQNPNDNGRANQ